MSRLTSTDMRISGSVRSAGAPWAAALLGALALLGAACAGGGAASQVGVGAGSEAPPPRAVRRAPENEGLAPYQGPRLDVIVPAFDPGIPEDPTSYEKKGVWPELRRVEANKFALSMKRALEETDTFGAVRVTPGTDESGELYVLGKIKKSNGEDVELRVEVRDVSGRRWMKKTYKHRVDEYFFHNPNRSAGMEPYDPVFQEIAADIAAILRNRKTARLENLQAISTLRFAEHFSEQDFSGYLKQSAGGIIKTTGAPAQDDPKLTRIQAIRVQDQLFVDKMQEHFEGFENRVGDSYSTWQKQSFSEAKTARELRNKSRLQKAAGALLVLGAIATASGSTVQTNSAARNAAVAAAVGGGVLIFEGFRTSQESKVHREAMEELGQSVDLALSPQVIEFEGEVVELKGTASEQFAQWRAFLQRMYELEKTPDTPL